MAFSRIAKLRLLVLVLISLVVIHIVLMINKNTKNRSVNEFIHQFAQDKFISQKIQIEDENEKISWEDVEFRNYELTRKGPGEFGEPVELTDTYEIKMNEQWLQKEGFYVNVSNKISFTRALPDLRPEFCHARNYHKNLPNISVVIVFYNEMTSTLLRCVHSIYNRTPKKLLHEIILINDKSTFDELYGTLHQYIKLMFGERVKLFENEDRQGLIKARMTGAKAATGEVLVFLDSHMEVYNGWVAPLLDVLVDHPDAAVVPTTDGMDAKTFRPTNVGYGHRGVFDWNFRYQWLPLRPEDKKVLGDPYELACLTGGAYAIRRKHFMDLGGYDEGLLIWNGENYELCIKLWLCSGGLYQAPCARVAHLSKHVSAYRQAKYGIDYIARNLKRVAEVWLDEYKEKLYAGDSERYAKVDIGDLTQQFAKKKSLNCKPFKYFLERVAPDMLLRYPLENIYFAEGKIVNLGSSEGRQRCLGRSGEITLMDCGNEYGVSLTLTLEKSIRLNDTNDQCLNSNGLNFSNCHHQGRDQRWKFDLVTRRIFSNDKKKCLQGNIVTSAITLENCDEFSKYQKWKWTHENVTALENFESTGVLYDK